MAPHHTLSDDEQSYAIKTWRRLRLSMPVLMVGLGISVGYERLKTHPGCFQGSISAYYYTPVHGIFVGALLAVAVCLVCLRGNTEREDVLLNLAGMFAALVALVPTPKPKTTCSSALDAVEDRGRNVGNNVISLLAVGAVTLLILLFLARKRRIQRQREARTQLNRRARGSQTFGYYAAVLLWLTTLLVFSLARGVFQAGAHYAAAIAMFSCIITVVEWNAWDLRPEPGTRRVSNRYHAVAILMIVSVVAFVIARAAGWSYWLIGLETALITLFAAFWVLQTIELWHQGLRKGSSRRI